MIGSDPLIEGMIDRLKIVKALKDWAEKHGMKKDPKMSGGYHFVTLYPKHIEEFWEILGVCDKR